MIGKMTDVPEPWHWEYDDGTLPMLMGDGHCILGCHVCTACQKRGYPCMTPESAYAERIAQLPVVEHELAVARERIRELEEMIERMGGDDIYDEYEC